MERPPIDIERIGLGKDCYVRKLTVEKARELFPSVAKSLAGMPAQQLLYSVHHADGTPFAISDHEGAAVSQGAGKGMRVWRLQ
jgi:hypothetical protein